ncbi:MAG: Maf family nucleotide pyrophosphatase [Flavobacteriaceae bacterium]
MFHDHTVILGSGSPRRRQLLQEMGIPFEIRLKEVDEVYPDHLKAEGISAYLAELKAAALLPTLVSNEILITADTVVWHQGQSLAKPADGAEAQQMLQTLSGDWHEVITSVCFSTSSGQQTLSSSTKVHFKTLSTSDIEYYISEFQPFDKAGAYGIQEWLGLIGIDHIEGSYTNVVGFPTALVHSTLLKMVAS